jgi:hypothetical protein
MKRAFVMKLSILGLLLLVMPVFAGTIMVDEFGNGLPFRIKLLNATFVDHPVGLQTLKRC